MARSFQSEMRVRLGLFLEAAGKAMQRPDPVEGELVTSNYAEGCMDIERVYPTQSHKLKFDLAGACRLRDVVCELPDGQIMTFAEVCLEGLSVAATIVPTCGADGVVRLFDVAKPLENVVKTINEVMLPPVGCVHPDLLKKPCTCATADLMARGCQCGATK